MQIERYRGDTTPDVCTIFSNTTGEPANIMGCSLKMTLSTAQNPTGVATQVYQIEGIIVDGANGVVEFSPTDEQANHVGYFYYDIQIVDTYGKTFTPVKSSYIYKQDITKS